MGPSEWTPPETPGGSAPDAADHAVRPVSAALRRHAVALTAPQSDALARLLAAGERRLVELLGLRNGTLCATLRGAGYAARRVYIAPDGRVVENEEAAEPDPFGEATEPFVVLREEGRLHLGTMLPPTEQRQTSGEALDEPRLREDESDQVR
jgi:hypothetical protein